MTPLSKLNYYFLYSFGNYTSYLYTYHVRQNLINQMSFYYSNHKFMYLFYFKKYKNKNPKWFIDKIVLIFDHLDIGQVWWVWRKKYYLRRVCWNTWTIKKILDCVTLTKSYTKCSLNLFLLLMGWLDRWWKFFLHWHSFHIQGHLFKIQLYIFFSTCLKYNWVKTMKSRVVASYRCFC